MEMPVVCRTNHPSICPTCERNILRTMSLIDFKFEIWYQTTKNTDAIDFATFAYNKMAAIKLLKCIL